MSDRRSPDSAMIVTYGFLWYGIYVLTDFAGFFARAVPDEDRGLVFVLTMSVLKWLLVAPLAWFAAASVGGLWNALWPARSDAGLERRAIYAGACAVAAGWFLLGIFVNTGWLDWDSGSQAFHPGVIGSAVHGTPFFAACLLAAFIIDRLKVMRNRRARTD